MANQFTKGTRKAHDDSTKDKIRAEQLSRRLYKYGNARGKGIEKHRMEPAQVAAAKVIIERGKPALQSIEQIQVNPLDNMSEEQLREQVRALITSFPWLLDEFRPGPRAGNEPESVEAAQQSQTPRSRTTHSP